MKTRIKIRKFVKTPYAMGLVGLVCLLWCCLDLRTSASGSLWVLLARSQRSSADTNSLAKRRSVRGPSTSGHSSQPVAPSPVRAPRRQTPQELGSLVEQMITDGRYALLLRPQIAGDLTALQFQQAFEMLEDEMALVPTGDVGLQLADFDDFPDRNSDEEIHEAIVRVDSLYMDRYPVTNEQYQAVRRRRRLRAVLNLAPRNPPGRARLRRQDRPCPARGTWNNGRYPPGKAKHPVVGVSWYEACAYARWVGKRLPTDAEWVKAASWPVSLGTSARRQRRYPWGEAMDRGRANLWSATVRRHRRGRRLRRGRQRRRRLPAHRQRLGMDARRFRSGLCRSAARRARTRHAQEHSRRRLRHVLREPGHVSVPKRRSSAARKHNIGFRCVLGTCDLAVDPTAPLTVPADERQAEYEVTV